jgi:hypothetical protein
MTTYPIGEAMTEAFTGTVSEMRVDRADYRCADCDDGDECCGCCECTFRTTPGLYLTVRLDDDTVGLHAGRVRVTYESPDQPEPVKPSREAVAAAMNAADVRFATAEHIANAGVGPDPGSWWEAMADAVLALLPAIPGQNPAELAAHDAEVAATALEDAAGAALSETKDKLLPGVVGASWLRARAATIRAEAQR